MPDVSNWLKACFSKHGHLTKATKHKKNKSPKWYRPAGSAPWMEVGGGPSLEIETLPEPQQLEVWQE